MTASHNKGNVKEEVMALLLSSILMFGYPFNMYVEYLIAAIMACVICMHVPKRALNCKLHNYILFCGIVWVISCLYSSNRVFALKYMFMYFAAYAIVVNLSTDTFRRMLKYLLILGGVHVAFVILDFFDHGLVINLSSKFLNGDQIDINNQLRMYSGACAGVTGQTGQAALFIVIFMFAAVALAIKEKIYMLLLVPAVIALLLTQKRSFLGFGVLLSLGYLLYEAKTASKLAKMMMVVLFVAALFLVQYYIKSYFDVSAVLDKFEGGSMSNRDVLWKKMFALFKSSPLIGIGLYSTDVIMGMTGHNVYIQLLCENGILGAPFFFVLFYKCLKISRKSKENTDIVAFSRLIMWFTLAYGLFGNPIYEIQTLTLFFISTAVLDRTVAEMDGASKSYILKSCQGK